MIKIWNLPEDTEQSHFTSDMFIEKSFAGLRESEASKIQEAFTKALVSNITVEQVLKTGNGSIIQRVIMQLPNKSIMISDDVVTEDFEKMESYLSEIKILKSIDKDKTTFLANLPHKIRGAVNSLIGISHILLTQKVANLSKEQSEYLKDIKRSVEYISKILDETSDLAEFKNLYDIPILRDVDLANPIENALESLKDDFRIKQISTSFKSKVKDKTCFVDDARLQNIIMSILQNSIYRSRPRGIIDIELSMDESKFILLISDNGRRYEIGKDSNNASSYNSLSITYAKMLLDSMNLELIARYDNEAKLSRFKIILVNDRTFHEFENNI
jgi:signal transduction histidine kinase